MNIIWTQISCLLFLAYLRDADSVPFHQEILYFSAATTAATLSSYALVVAYSKPSLRGSFFSPMTGSQLAEKIYETATSDAVIASQCFGLHPDLITPALKSELKLWIWNGWETWNTTLPPWFTDVWRRNVPLDMLPMTLDAEHLKEDRSRRSGGPPS